VTPDQQTAGEIGPQRPGGRYRCGFWAEDYTVLSIDLMPGSWPSWQISVQWADGSITTHSTLWDPHRDTVITQPPETA
jgi:hypothetical protein